MIFTQNKAPELHIRQPAPQSRLLSSAQRLRSLERSTGDLLIVRTACFVPVIQKILMTVVFYDCDESAMLIEVPILDVCSHDGCIK